MATRTRETEAGAEATGTENSESVTPTQAIEAPSPTALTPFFADLKHFAFAAPVQPPLVDFPIMIWGKGVKVIAGSGVKKPALYTGGLIEQEQDADFDAVMNDRVPWVTVEHLSKKRTNYWRFDTIEAFILCHGIPQHYSDDVTLAMPYVWNPHPGYNAGTHLQCMMFLRPFIAVYPRPVVFSLSRTVIKHFINNALLKQFKYVLEPLQEVWQLAGNQEPLKLAYYAFSVTIKRGDEVEVGGQNGSTMIKPPVADMPENIDEAYLRQHFIKPEEVKIIESFLEILPTWAKDAAYQLTQPPRAFNKITEESDAS